MERMEEHAASSEYRAYQYFISNSKWDCEGSQMQVARDTSNILNQQKKFNSLPVGDIVDESTHIKNGKVSRC